MKELMKQYGGFVLAGVVLLVLLILLFSGVTDEQGNRGIIKIVAAKLDTEGTDYAAYTDYDTYKTESTKTAPEITYQDIGYFPVGTVNFLQHVTATDYAGRRLSNAGSVVDDAEKGSGYLKITNLEDASGNDLSANINAETGEITLPEAGIYEVTIRAQDDGYRKSKSVIRVPAM